VKDKYVYLDQGGKLFNYPGIRKVLAEFNYKIYPTEADSSHQNRFVERSHGHISGALCAKLTGANLNARFWPRAFLDYSWKHNAIHPAPGQTKSSFKAATSHHENFKDLRTFGCQVWVHPPRKQWGKLQMHAHKGIFLGYLRNALKTILWFDLETKGIKIAFHAHFHKGMNELPALLFPPNVQHIQHGKSLHSEFHDLAPMSLTFTNNPFLNKSDETIPISCQDPTFGLTIATNEISSHAYISSIASNSSASHI
jgi:hypothetical protein